MSCTAGCPGLFGTEAISHYSEEQRRVVICEIGGGKDYEMAFGHVEVLALVSQIYFAAIGGWNVLSTDEHLSQ